MNRDRLEGKWKQLGGKIDEQWGRLTGDTRLQLAGRRDQLKGRIQERHGISTEKAANQLKDFLNRNRKWDLSSR